MLILTRRVGETLMIGDEVTVTVLGVKGNQVRIGVNALKKCLFTVKRSTSVFRLKNPSSPVTKVSAPRCAVRRITTAAFSFSVFPLRHTAFHYPLPLWSFGVMPASGLISC